MDLRDSSYRNRSVRLSSWYVCVCVYLIVFSGVEDTTKILQSIVNGLIYRSRKCIAAGRK